ncbi:hypothetical protein B0H19DRAFT_1065427 [Mycena capillaripes]|nr:hypothetical protein B0H19DRAFT_1065427 [Mycena capillaripes]
MAISIFGVASGVAFLVGRATHTVLTPCFAEWFMTARCVHVALDMALPMAIPTTLFCAVVHITRRAVAVHGDEMVLRPVTPTLMPAFVLAEWYPIVALNKTTSKFGSSGLYPEMRGVASAFALNEKKLYAPPFQSSVTQTSSKI